MNILLNISLTVLTALVTLVGAYNYIPLDSVTFSQPIQKFGSTITPILGSDTLSSSRSVNNTNLSNLNTDKIEAGNANVFTALQIFGSAASTTQISSFNGAYFGSTATSTFNSVGDLLVVGSTTLQNFTSKVGTSTIFTATTVNTTNFASTNGTTTNATTTTLAIGSQLVTAYQTPGFTYSTTTWSGTTTINLPSPFFQSKINNITCYSDVGSVWADFYHTTTHLTLFSASTTQGIMSFTSNNTMTPQEKWYVNLGTPASSPTTVTCSIKKENTSY